MNLATLFWNTCENAGDRVAIASQSSSRTFAELRSRVSSLTHSLHDLGIRKGDRIAICSRNSPEYIEAYWACVSIGAIVVALNFRLTTNELQQLCRFADVKAYFCSSATYGMITLAEPEAGGAKPIVVWDGDAPASAISFETLVSRHVEPVVSTMQPDDVCCIIFTGGTSGTPKGVARTHRNALAQLLLGAGHDLIGSSQVVMACTPFFHVAGQLAIIALAVGHAVVTIEGSFSAEKFLRLVEQYRVGSAFLVPSMVSEVAAAADSISADTSSLTEMRSGGAPLLMEVAQRLRRRFPALRFRSGAGSTEAGTMGSAWWDELANRGFGCVGRPPVGQEIQIMGDDGRVCSTGELGEIMVRGAWVARGYWGNEEQSKNAFSDGWQHTADIGKVDEDGYLYLLDRKSDMIISGGENIYAREVEEVLYRCPEVKEAAVIGLQDARWGEIPVAVVVASDDDAATDKLRQLASEWLASYKRPQRYVFVHELPRTSVGKIDKRALRALLQE